MSELDSLLKQQQILKTKISEQQKREGNTNTYYYREEGESSLYAVPFTKTDKTIHVKYVRVGALNTRVWIQQVQSFSMLDTYTEIGSKAYAEAMVKTVQQFKDLLDYDWVAEEKKIEEEKIERDRKIERERVAKKLDDARKAKKEKKPKKKES